MTTLAAAALWCVVQTALVAMLGVATTWLWSRRAPGSAALAASSAASTILAVTMLAPLPLPKIAIDSAPVGREWSAPQPETSKVGAASSETEERQDGDSRAGVAADVGGTVAGAGRALRGAATTGRNAAGECVAGVVLGVLAAGAVGSVRLITALRYVSRLRSEGAPIRDAELSVIAGQLGERLGLRRHVEFIESTAIASPAALGWRRPAIVLPVAWRSWSAEQLQAALAHELAHVARGDFPWRVAASAALALHAFHPLMHWLSRRLVLMQELAADDLAAAAMGGSAKYLRAISQLALRLDDALRPRAEPRVLPAFSSNLMRRIAMLRSKDGRVDAVRRRAGGVAAAGLIALVGVATMALGGAAETPPAPAALAAPTEPFARPALDVTVAGHSDLGVFVVRLHELSLRAPFALLVQLMNQEIGQAWPRFFKGVPTPAIRFEEIEYIAGAPSLVLRAKTGEAPGQGGQLMCGAGEVVVLFRSDVDWRDWIKTYVPGAETATDDGFTYVRLPVIPAFGRESYLLAARDGRTLVATGGNLDRLKVLAAGDDPKPAGLVRTWTALEGGLATALFAAPKIDGDAGAFANEEAAAAAQPTAEEKSVLLAGNAVLRAVGAKVQQVGVAFDLDPATNRAAVRLRLVCRDEASAEGIRTALTVFLPIARLGLIASREAGPQAPSDPSIHVAIVPENEKFHREGHDFWLAMLNGCRIECEPQADGTSHVCLVAEAPFVPTLVQVQQVAERTDARPASK